MNSFKFLGGAGCLDVALAMVQHYCFEWLIVAIVSSHIRLSCSKNYVEFSHFLVIYLGFGFALLSYSLYGFLIILRVKCIMFSHCASCRVSVSLISAKSTSTFFHSKHV